MAEGPQGLVYRTMGCQHPCPNSWHIGDESLRDHLLQEIKHEAKQMPSNSHRRLERANPAGWQGYVLSGVNSCFLPSPWDGGSGQG